MAMVLVMGGGGANTFFGLTTVFGFGVAIGGRGGGKGTMVD